MGMDGLREKKKRETRIALSWAAVRLTVERGYQNVRIEDIAAEAGVSLRTFRNYFASKGEAIAARQVDRIAAIADGLRSRPAEEPLWVAIRAALEEHYLLGQPGQGTAQPPDERWLAGVRLMGTEPALRGELAKAHAQIQEYFAQAVADRTGATGLYPRLVAAVFSSTIATVSEEWQSADPPRPLDALLDEALDLLTTGLPEPHPRT
jgi:AcrR family transcriptional regulator